MTTVSVIITTFNSAHCIEKTIHSVLGQDGIGRDFDIELIVADDCSTDATADVLKRFPLDFFFRSGVNSGGPNRGRNLGLKVATGDYICFLDHDDMWYATKLKDQLEAASEAPIITCRHSTNSIERLPDTLDGRKRGNTVFSRNETFLKKLSREKKDVQNTYLSTIMIHRDLKNILFEENFGMLDFDWILRLFEQRSSVEVPKTLVYRFVDNRNLSLALAYRRKDYYFSLMTLEVYKEKHEKEVRKALARINGSRARYHYMMGEMQEARKYLLKSMPGIKEGLYFITSYVGSTWVRKNFSVFG